MMIPGRAEAALHPVAAPRTPAGRGAAARRRGSTPSSVVIVAPSAWTASIRQARAVRPFDRDRARAAHAVLAAQVRGRQVELLAQEVGERQARGDLGLVLVAVDGQPYAAGAHRRPPPSPARARGARRPAPRCRRYSGGTCGSSGRTGLVAGQARRRGDGLARGRAAGQLGLERVGAHGPVADARAAPARASATRVAVERDLGDRPAQRVVAAALGDLDARRAGARRRRVELDRRQDLVVGERRRQEAGGRSRSRRSRARRRARGRGRARRARAARRAARRPGRRGRCCRRPCRASAPADGRRGAAPGPAAGSGGADALVVLGARAGATIAPMRIAPFSRATESRPGTRRRSTSSDGAASRRLRQRDEALAAGEHLGVGIAGEQADRLVERAPARRSRTRRRLHSGAVTPRSRGRSSRPSAVARPRPCCGSSGRRRPRRRSRLGAVGQSPRAVLGDLVHPEDHVVAAVQHVRRAAQIADRRRRGRASAAGRRPAFVAVGDPGHVGEAVARVRRHVVVARTCRSMRPRRRRPRAAARTPAARTA